MFAAFSLFSPIIFSSFLLFFFSLVLFSSFFPSFAFFHLCQQLLELLDLQFLNRFLVIERMACFQWVCSQSIDCSASSSTRPSHLYASAVTVLFIPSSSISWLCEACIFLCSLKSLVFLLQFAFVQSMALVSLVFLVDLFSCLNQANNSCLSSLFFLVACALPESWSNSVYHCDCFLLLSLFPLLSFSASRSWCCLSLLCISVLVLSVWFAFLCLFCFLSYLIHFDYTFFFIYFVWVLLSALSFFDLFPAALSFGFFLFFALLSWSLLPFRHCSCLMCIHSCSLSVRSTGMIENQIKEGRADFLLFEGSCLSRTLLSFIVCSSRLFLSFVLSQLHNISLHWISFRGSQDDGNDRRHDIEEIKRNRKVKTEQERIRRRKRTKGTRKEKKDRQHPKRKIRKRAGKTLERRKQKKLRSISYLLVSETFLHFVASASFNSFPIGTITAIILMQWRELIATLIIIIIVVFRWGEGE